jgi:hypothetical protein
MQVEKRNYTQGNMDLREAMVIKFKFQVDVPSLSNCTSILKKSNLS